MGTAQRVCERKSVWVGLGWSLEFYVEMSGWVVESNLDRTVCPELRNIFPLRNTRAVKKCPEFHIDNVGHKVSDTLFGKSGFPEMRLRLSNWSAAHLKLQVLSSSTCASSRLQQLPDYRIRKML